MLLAALLCSQCLGAAADADAAGSCAVEVEALAAGVGLPLGLRKRVIWDEPVGALSNLLAVMNSDVMAQPGLVPAQRLICTASSHTERMRDIHTFTSWSCFHARMSSARFLTSP